MPLNQTTTNPATARQMLDAIFELFGQRGSFAYLGEPVSQLEHALQAATAARRAGASSPLIAAALLHDIGHLIHDRGDDCADHGIDTRHEEMGARWLQAHFGPEVTEPILLHVAAKRYLCATDPGYFQSLSPASVQSLRLQGGPFSDDEARRFRAGPHAQAAVDLRRWDEAAKIPGLLTPNLDHFRSHLERALGLPAASDR